MVRLAPETITALIHKSGGTALSDAVLATYSLSLMGDWERAWKNTAALLAPQSKVSVVNMAVPTGCGRWLAPLARLACAMGGSDINAAPWRAVEERCTAVVRASARAGHQQIRAGKTAPDCIQ